ncbi:hypothetical protein BDN71DRAFT_1441615 [Pleurotus eryngii]|uniref:Uncharacterized protein n=1 Tax=Pleurotus eryngii TaxID=5323 RepID=A0A9P6A3R0_PLEER|nr:hypothetical protein BDN71DRAFT_1441615 [Pleurotus eryngii]
MPHKKAKRSIRERERSEKGSNLAPAQQSLATEALPKSLTRVLNASQIREDWHAKKRKNGEEDGRGTVKRNKTEKGAKGKTELSIMPGESIQHFNKRVEDNMRPLVKTAMQSSNATLRKARKELPSKKKCKNKTSTDPESDQDEPHAPAPSSQKHDRNDPPKEFATLSSSAPRRLNDIAQAPPELKAFPRAAAMRAKNGDSKRPKMADNILSMAQKAMMEEEREKAIKRYRELKASRMATTS